MIEQYDSIIAKSIELELLMADLYLLFKEEFPQDEDFWWKMVIEEKNHASIIKSIQQIGDKFDEPVGNVFASNLEDIIREKNRLNSILVNYRGTPPTRTEAFNTALEFEQSAGELHYQKGMKDNHSSSVIEVYRRLNRYDLDHAQRIKNYMETNGIDCK